MKKAAILFVIAAMIVCVIPIIDSSDAAATPATTISGYFFNDSKDISTSSSITIKILYYDGISDSGIVVGTGDESSVFPKTTGGTNKFTVTIVPETDLALNHYYFYFSINGFSILSTPHKVDSAIRQVPLVDGTTTTILDCYNITDTTNIVSNTENIIGSTTDVFTMQSAIGMVKGTVTTNSTEPTYLNGVKVTLYDLKTEENLVITYTSNHGAYSIDYNTGNYGIKFELGGYDTVTDEVTIGKDITTTVNGTLVENQSYFGMDLPHALMILGGALAVVLFLFTMFVRMTISRK